MTTESSAQHATDDTDTAAGCLQLEQFNAVVVGGGAIGMALVQGLLANPGLENVTILARQQHSDPADARVSYQHFDATDPQSIQQAFEAVKQRCKRVHLLINTVGMLHSDTQQPEKRLRDVSAESLQQSFMINAVLVPLLAQAFGPLLRHSEPAVFASLSARVGSIEDNRLGGWYSYRASKAAQNMLLRTLAREWGLSHRKVSVLALHPGTVASRLSDPFISKNYDKRVLTPDECASALLNVIAGVRPGETGEFYDWQGERIPW